MRIPPSGPGLQLDFRLTAIIVSTGQALGLVMRPGRRRRYADGHPITSRRYDHLWTRLGRQLPWVRTQQVSSHWIRHTTS